MRQVVLDTETTGLDVSKGHRVIEIGCVELVNRRRTIKSFHQYIQPDREIDEGAVAVHGITNQQLANQPRFNEISQELIDFIDGAELIIHNADFDVGFLDQEFQNAGLESIKISGLCEVTDTLPMARRMHPGQRNSLDALCKRYMIDNSRRDLHGALLDAQLLADVYLAMTGGQGALSLDSERYAGTANGAGNASLRRGNAPLSVVRATQQEHDAHDRQLDLIDKASADGALWQKLDA
jgi:DNA polymerase-3 subunit epsilon